MFKSIKKLLIMLGLTEDPGKTRFQTVVTNIGGLLKEFAPIDAAPPMFDDLHEMTVGQGYKGPKQARPIGKYLHSKGLCPVWHGDHWSIEAAPDFCY